MASWDQNLHIALLVFVPLLVALIIFIVRAVNLSRTRRIQWGAEIPAGYVFSTSWATNLSVIGGILFLALAISSGFGAGPTLFARESDYLWLTLLFAFLALAAVFLCTALRVPNRVETNVAVFFVACVLTTWALLAQLLTIGFFIGELLGQRLIIGLVAGVFWVAFGCLAIALVWYAWQATATPVLESATSGVDVTRGADSINRSFIELRERLAALGNDPAVEDAIANLEVASGSAGELIATLSSPTVDGTQRRRVALL